MSEMRNLAIFDYDHTLIEGDSLWPFLCYAAGRLRTTAVLGQAVAAYGWRRLWRRTGQSARTFVKAYLLRRLLTGRRRNRMGEAARRVRRWQKFNPAVLQKLRLHQARGDAVVIASGALDLYMPELLRGVPYDALICTEVGEAGGVLTGEMVRGNCVRSVKAERVRAWMAEHGPFGETFAYGNVPHDVPMMELARYRIVVA